MQDRIVIFPHLLLKDSNDVYPFPMQRVTDGDGDEEEEEEETEEKVTLRLDVRLSFITVKEYRYT